MAWVMARSRSVRSAPIERVDLNWVEDPRQATHATHERQATTTARTALTRGDAPGHRVGRHRHIVTGDQIAIEARDRRPAAA